MLQLQPIIPELASRRERCFIPLTVVNALVRGEAIPRPFHRTGQRASVIFVQVRDLFISGGLTLSARLIFSNSISR